MVLYAIKHYGPREEIRSAKLKYSLPETLPAIAIYHPDATGLFETFESYSSWHEKRPGAMGGALDPSRTIGLLLMRPQIVSHSRKHYDGLIRAIEREGLSVIPAISTFMDNRISCEKFFFTGGEKRGDVLNESDMTRTSRVSQVVSLTGFSFVGGPAMNDSEAALGFLKDLNRPFKSIVSLDTQTIGKWELSGIGLNPVQSGMQVAIPEIDGATEPFIYGGLPDDGTEPVPLEERCLRIARRLKRWNRLQVADRADLKIALTLFCFPPNKGNIGTAADLDVIPSVMAILEKLRADGYTVEVPSDPGALRRKLIEGNSESYGTSANVAYAMSVDEYWSLCPYVDEIEAEWGSAPGGINSFAGKLLIHGFQAGNVFIAVQPSFGYEGDPMRMLMARSGAPHHGFMALYTFLEKKFGADAVIHVGTHGALEFMPGKQVGLSSSCWPDRLIGELPNLYIYSVNNPSEGTIAKRRSYAELISYLTPPIENAGLYRELETMKELICSYRMTGDEVEKTRLYAAIQNAATSAHFGDLSI
jgi:magnesium chelatase subunit H